MAKKKNKDSTSDAVSRVINSAKPVIQERARDQVRKEQDASWDKVQSGTYVSSGMAQRDMDTNTQRYRDYVASEQKAAQTRALQKLREQGVTNDEASRKYRGDISTFESKRSEKETALNQIRNDRSKVYSLFDQGELDTEENRRNRKDITKRYGIDATSYKDLYKLYKDLADTEKSARSEFSAADADLIGKKQYDFSTGRINDLNRAEKEVKRSSDFAKYSRQGENMENVDVAWTGKGIENAAKYYRDNDRMSEMTSQGVESRNPYEYMTDDEYSIYNYYLAKEGKDKAEEYFNSIADRLNARMAQSTYENIEDNTAMELAFGVAAGYDQWKSGKQGFIKFLSGDTSYTPTSAEAYTSSLIKNDLQDSKAAGIAYDLISTTTNMVPSIMLSVVTGGIAGEAEAVGMIGSKAARAVTEAGKLAGSIDMGSGAAGNAYTQMINAGYDKNQARTYGTIIGIAETTLQEVIGGIGSLGGKLTGASLKAMAEGINNAAIKYVLEAGGSMFAEGNEEFLQDILEPFIKSFATGEMVHLPENYIADALYSGMLGALSAGPMEVIPSSVNTMAESSLARSRYGDNVQDLIGQGMESAEGTRSRELAEYAQSRLDKNKKVSGITMQDMVNANEQAMVEEDTAVLREAVVQRLQEQGETGDVEVLADAIVKTTTGTKLTKSEKKAVEKSEVASEVISDVSPQSIATGRSGQWTSSLSPNRVNADAYQFAEQTIDDRNEQTANKYHIGQSYLPGIARTEPLSRTIERNSKLAPNPTTASDKALNINRAAVNDSVSDTGSTVVKSTGEKVDITRLESVDSASPKLVLSDGSTVSKSDIEYNSEGTAVLIEYLTSNDFDTDTANQILALAKDRDGDMNRFLLGVDSGIKYGTIGIEPKYIDSKSFFKSLRSSEQSYVYNIGRSIAEKTTQQKSEQRQAQKTNQKINKGRVDMTGVEGLSERQKADLSVIGYVTSAITHGTVHFYESVAEIPDGVQGAPVAISKSRRVLTDDSILKQTKKGKGDVAPNGFYVQGTGDIYLDINAGNNGEGVMLWTFSHELTHFIKDWNPTGYKNLADFLVAEYGENGVFVDELVAKKMAELGTDDYEYALEEVVADSMTAMLTDTDALVKLRKLHNKDASLYNKIRTFIRDMLTRVQNAYKELKGRNMTSEQRLLSEMEGSLQRMSDLFAEALVEAGETFEATSIEGIAEEYGISEQEVADLKNDHLDIADGLVVSEQNAELIREEGLIKPTNPGNVYSWRTLDRWANDYLNRYGDTAENRRTIEAVKSFTGMMIADDAVKAIVPGGDFIYDTYGPLRTNDEYAYTFDLDTSCPRTFQFLAYRDRLKQIAKRELTYAETVQLIELMRVYNQQIPCTYCYVENKRMDYAACYYNFFQYRNNVLNEKSSKKAVKLMYGLDKKGNLSKGAQEAFDRWRQDMTFNPTVEEVWTSANQSRNSVFNYLDSLYDLGEIDATTSDTALGKKVVEKYEAETAYEKSELNGFAAEWAYDIRFGIEHTYITDNTGSIDDVDLRVLDLHHEAVRYANSASSAHGVDNYVPYTDQLRALESPDKTLKNGTPVKQFINSMGGFRKHSSNDFRIDYVQDYFMFYADLAAGGWKGHTYTKNIEFAKIFGRCGDRINVSIAMYDTANGVAMNEQEGANWDEAKEVRAHYKHNVGIMAMATSDKQLSFGLNADWIDMIIPFHASGLKKIVWKDLKNWFDYTSKQHERFFNKDEKVLAILQKRLADKGIEYEESDYKAQLIEAGKERTDGADTKARGKIVRAEVKRLKAIMKSNGIPLSGLESTQAINDTYNSELGITVVTNESGKVVKPHFLPGPTLVKQADGSTVEIPGHNNDAQRYLDLCREYGVHPRFDGITVQDANGNDINIADHPGYLKVIKETARTETEQQAIQFNFNEHDDYLGMSPMDYAMQKLQEFADNSGYENDKRDDLQIVDQFVKEYLGKNKPMNYIPDSARKFREKHIQLQNEISIPKSVREGVLGAVNPSKGVKMSSRTEAGVNDVQHSNRSDQELPALKTLKGSRIQRSKYGVGKQMGSQIYVHKNYAEEIVPTDIYQKAVRLLPKDFSFNCIMYDQKNPNEVRFDEAPDFDRAREPKPGKMLRVNVSDGTVAPAKGNGNMIWHHKWQWVRNDYAGFDVQESYDWSKTWLSKITNPSGSLRVWNQNLRDNNLPVDSENNTMYSDRVEHESLSEDQTVNSKDTSVPQTARTFTEFDFSPTDRILDYGGGQFDIAKKAVEAIYPGIKIEIVDKYNRTVSHNNRIFEEFSKTPADAVTVNNVLNVVDGKSARLSIVRESKSYLKKDGVAYFLMYNASGKKEGAEGRITRTAKNTEDSNWQNNKPALFYEPEIKQYYKHTRFVAPDYIIASDSKEALDAVKKVPAKVAKERKAIAKPFSADPELKKSMRDVLYSTRNSLGDELTLDQQEYFKDSKVRDEDGNLLVVYHGTSEEFTVFDRTKSRSTMDIQGNFFSPWEIDAGGYGENVGAYYLNITNPAPEGIAYKALNLYKGQNDAGVKARQYLEKKGYDGVNNGNEEYIAFNPEQIKLIDNQNPTSSEDIRYSERDSAGNRLSKKQQEYFKRSKARDDNGNLLTLYHGTQNAGFNEFKTGRFGAIWLTTSKKDADSYGGNYEGKLYDPEEKAEARDVIGGNYTSGYFRFDSQEELDSFRKQFPNIDEYKDYWELARMEEEIDSDWESEDYDDRMEELDRIRSESRKIERAYARYETKNSQVITIGEMLDNPDLYSYEDFYRAGLAHDKEFDVDEGEYESKEDAKNAIVEALSQISGEESAEGYNEDENIRSLSVKARVPKGASGTVVNLANRRTYALYANLENPYVFDDHGRRSEGNGYRYGAIRNALESGKYDGVIVKNARVGANQELGTVVVATSGEQLKLSSNENPTESQDIRYSNRGRGYDSRTLLSNALETVAQNETERQYIQKYQAKIAEINADQNTLAEVRQELQQIRYATGQKMTDRITELTNRANTLADKIARADKQLLKLEAAKPLKDVLEREKAVAIRREREAGQEALSALRERTETRMSKNRYIPRIEKLTKELSDWAIHPDPKKGRFMLESFKGPVLNFLKALDFQTYAADGTAREGNANAFRVEQQQAIAAFAEKFSDYSIESDYGHLDLAPDMLEWVQKMSENYTRALSTNSEWSVRTMSPDELYTLYKLLKSLKTSIRNADRFYMMSSTIGVNDLARGTIDHLAPLAGHAERKMFKGADSILRWDYAQPVTVFDRFGESGQKIYKGLIKGQNAEARNIQKILDFTDEAYTKEEVKQWREEIAPVTVKKVDIDENHNVTEREENYNVTKAQLMELYLLMKDPDARRHIIEGGGIRFDNVEIKGKTTRYTNTMVSEEDVTKMLANLSEREREVADNMQKFLSGTGAEWGNAISMRRFGYKAFGDNQNYYPIKTIKGGTSAEYEAKTRTANIFALLNKSFTKERNINANNAIIVSDLFKTFTNHMSEMAIYNAWALPTIDMIKWFNFKVPQDVEAGVDETSVRDAMRMAYGDNAYNYVRRLLESINSQSSGGLSESVAFKNLRMVNRTAVAANIRVAVQQPFSITRAMELLPAKYMKPLFGQAHKAAYDEMIEHSGFGAWKDMGYYDVDVSRPLEAKVLKNESFADRVTEKGMFLAEKGDQFTWATLWNACKTETKAKNPGISEEDLIEKTTDRFDDLIARTQVVDSVLTKSQWMRSDSFWHRMTSSFMSEPMTSYNTLLRQFDKFQRDLISRGRAFAVKNNKKAIATTVGVFLLTQVVNGLATAPIDAMRDESDDEYWKKLLAKFRKNVQQNLIPTSMMPYISDIADYIIYGSEDRPDMALYTKVIDLGKSVSKTISNYSPEKLNYTMKSALDTASSLTGIPMGNVTRDVLSIYNQVVGGTGHSDLKFRTKSQNTANSELTGDSAKVFRILTGGDADRIARLKGMYDTEDKWKNARRKALREQDPRITEAAQKKLDGDFAGYKSLVLEIKGESAFSQDDIIASINTKINELDTGVTESSEPKAKGLFTNSDLQASVNEGNFAEIDMVRQDLYDTKVLNGTDEDAALKQVNEATRVAVKDSYYADVISTSHAVEMLVTYNGLDPDTAEQTVRYWEFKKANPELDITDTAIDNYYDIVQPSGISLRDYADYINRTKDLEGDDLNGDGEVDSGTKKVKVLVEIDALPITSEQKDALYAMNGWSMRRLYEAPWH